MKKDQAKIDEILNDFSFKNRISKVDAIVFQGEFSTGDDLMYVGVAGDIRENVFPALQELVNRIKTEAVFKEEKS